MAWLTVLPFLLGAAAQTTRPTSQPAAAPTFQGLMNPASFPEPQFGMRVESADIADQRLQIRTTGAVMEMDLRSGRGIFRQRVGAERGVLAVEIAGIDGPADVTHRGPGLAFVRHPAFHLRVNGDSLFMLQARRPLRIVLRRRIDCGFTASWKANHVLFDEWGGFGLYCSQQEIDDAFDPYGDVTARYELPADAVLWIGICPPKPYDWERSLRDNVVWHWSNSAGYPRDDALKAWSREGNIVLLQSEVMLWKDWNLAFQPRLGAAEFARVRGTVHRLGMRFIVYTSPFYFLRGTALESAAMNNFENFRGWPPGRPTGENMGLFLAEIEGLLREHRPDGLYFDGQYSENPAALYALARRSRALVGDGGLLEWHSTSALGPDLCFLPHADAYVDFILRGEGREPLYAPDAGASRPAAERQRADAHDRRLDGGRGAHAPRPGALSCPADARLAGRGRAARGDAPDRDPRARRGDGRGAGAAARTARMDDAAAR